MEYGKTDFLTDFTVEDLNHAMHKELYEYWNLIRGKNLMPPRSDFKPMDIHKILPEALLVDVFNDPRRYKFRLIGSSFEDIIGYKPTGDWIDEYPDTEEVIQRFDWLVENKKPYYTVCRLPWGENKDYEYYSALAVPFSSDGNTVDKIISSNFCY